MRNLGVVFLLLVANPLAAQVQAPVLKWSHGGCHASWCETGWYSSPAVADLEGNGQIRVIGATYSVIVVDGATGALIWRVPTGHDLSNPGAGNVGRTWPGVIVADIDDDGWLEIATAHGGGWVSVYERNGFFASGWPQRPSPTMAEIRGLAAADLDRDGRLDLVATRAGSGATNTWVLGHDGVLRAGWPRTQSTADGFAAGVYNSNTALADLDRDGIPEIVVPSDVHYVCAYRRNGSPLPADPATWSPPKPWGQVGVWESLATELQGWGTCSLAEGRNQRYRTNFADGPATVADLDRDGFPEIVVTGNTQDCATSPYTSKYTGVFVLQPDRRRWQTASFDWRTTVPIDTGAPISEDYGEIESALPNPVVADLDGDGIKEILFAAYDGRLHAFWLDRTEHGNWPYAITPGGGGVKRFASEPTVVDLDGDGLAEVLVGTWTQKGSAQSGSLLIVDHHGNLLHSAPIPAPPSPGPTWNGALAAPTVADIDGDGELEVVLQTAFSGLVAWDLPGTTNAVVHWGTGRGSFTRAGTPAPRVIFGDGFESGDLSAWSASGG